jgi:4-amino-4-deoxy-L-arabinose transferase-like glycosyltransferase
MTPLTRQTVYSVWTLIAFFALLRLFTAPFFGLGVDEAHYVLYAKHLELSYFDHPPLVGWLHLPLLGFAPSELAARVPPITLGAITSYFVYKLVLEIFADRRIAFWSTLALNSSFIFGALFLMLLPDTILIALSFALMSTLISTTKNPNLKNYLLLGLLLGLCGLSKYTAVILIPAILLFLFLDKKLSLLLSPKTLLTVFTALAVIYPVVIWNIQNDFASFAYQGSHVAGANTFSPLILAKNIGIWFGAYSPPLFVIASYGLSKSAKSANIAEKLAFYIGIFLLGFFLFTAALKPALPHWIAPFFALFIPLGVAHLLSSGYEKTAKYSILFSLAVTLLLHLELAAKIGTFTDLKSPFRDIYGRSEAALTAKRLKPANTDIALLNWSEASRIAYYANESVFVADSRKDQFDIWYTKEPLGRDFLFVLPISSTDKLENSCECEEVKAMGHYDAKLNGGLVDGFDFVLCKNFKGMKK